MKDYNKSILEYSDVRDAANYAREEGFKYGVIEGEEKGVEKGRKERDIEIAKILLSENKSIDTIIKYTGLTSEEIEALR
jgi:hypothetical protein